MKRLRKRPQFEGDQAAWNLAARRCDTLIAELREHPDRQEKGMQLVLGTLEQMHQEMNREQPDIKRFMDMGYGLERSVELRSLPLSERWIQQYHEMWKPLDPLAKEWDSDRYEPDRQD